MQIGPDTVYQKDGHWVIVAAHDMPDWRLREFCRVPIYFQEKKYFLCNRVSTPSTFQFELAPWPAGLHEQSPRHIIYNEDYVLARDALFKTERTNHLIHHVLLVFYPFLGFFWSGLKQGKLAQCGFAPKEITGISIAFAFCFFLLEAIFVLYFGGGWFLALLGNGRCLGIPLLSIDHALFLLLPIDCAVRFNQLLRDDDHSYGFLEWVFQGSESRL